MLSAGVTVDDEKWWIHHTLYRYSAKKATDSNMCSTDSNMCSTDYS